jgi:hypothetical protein
MSLSNRLCRSQHAWENWEQVPDSCTAVRVCRRCNQTEQKEKHIWGRWEYEVSDSCTQARVCKQCGKMREIPKITTHVWGPWEYEAVDSCQQVRVCTRCGQTEYETRHIPGDWQYRHPDRCEQARVCTRCREEELRVEHEWVEWEYEAPGTCQQMRVCSRCQEVESRTKHIWGKVDPRTREPVCDRCGEKYIYDSRPCPQCGEYRLVYDGMLVWRSGPRPPRNLARKKVGFSPRADYERERCYHCAACKAEFFEDMEIRQPHLYEEGTRHKYLYSALKRGWDKVL